MVLRNIGPRSWQFGPTAARSAQGIVGEILELKKVFYLFFVSVLSIPTRVAFVVLEFVFATPVCYVTNFLLFTVIHKPNESQGTQLITCLRSVRSVVFNKPKRTRPSAIATYANIPR